MSNQLPHKFHNKLILSLHLSSALFSLSSLLHPSHHWNLQCIKWVLTGTKHLICGRTISWKNRAICCHECWHWGSISGAFPSRCPQMFSSQHTTKSRVTETISLSSILYGLLLLITHTLSDLFGLWNELKWLHSDKQQRHTTQHNRSDTISSTRQMLAASWA